MKRKLIALGSLVLLLTVLSVGKVFALIELPSITSTCEDKLGHIFSINDGFSMFKTCPKGTRAVIILGQQGPKGDKGDQGIQGIQGIVGEKGDKGDPGEPASLPNPEEIVFLQVILPITNYHR